MLRRIFSCATLVAAALFGATTPAAAAQDPPPEIQEGLVIEAIELIGAESRDAEVLEGIPLRVGTQFQRRILEASVSWLWKYKRILVVEVTGREGSTASAIILSLRVEVMPSWRRAVFTGYEAYDREELEMWAGLVGQPVDRGAVSTIIQRIEERYHEDGYAKVEIKADYRDDDDEVRFVIAEGPKVTVSELAFEGNDAIVGGNWWTIGLDIREALNNKPGALFLSDSAYSEARLREDENAILQLYSDYGFLEARVSHEVEYVADDEVKVTYFIEEGPLYRVRSVTIVSLDGAELRFSEEELRAEIGLQSGAPYELARVRSDVFALQRFYGARGYPSSARVNAERLRRDSDYFRIQDPLTRRPGPVVVIDEEQALVDIRFEIHEGLPKRVRDIVIRGNARSEDRIIRREVQTEPGDLAIEEDALRTYRRLIGLGYFRDRNRVPFVRWHWQDIGDQELVDLVFEVMDEATNNRLRFGGSFSSENGPAILIELQKQNFDLTDLPTSWGGALGEIWDGSAFTGAGQSLNLSMQPGSRYSTYSLAFTEPDLLREHIDRLSLTVFGRKTVRLLSTYEEERSNLGFRVGRRFGRYFTVFAGPEWGAVKVSDVDPLAPLDLIGQDGKNDLNTFTAGVRYNTVEDPFSPVDGGDVGVTLAQTGGFMGGTWDYVKGEVRLSNYIPLWQDSRGRHWVLATRGRVSQAWFGDDLTTLPYTERFYIGGHSTVRGYQYRGIGEDGNGFANGGDVAWTGSLEMRFPVLSSRQRGQVDEFEMIRGGLFLDMGSYGQEWDMLTQTRAAVGIGIRMRFPAMPTAPLSLDFGWPIRSVDGDDERVFSFTFGNF